MKVFSFLTVCGFLFSLSSAVPVPLTGGDDYFQCSLGSTTWTVSSDNGIVLQGSPCTCVDPTASLWKGPRGELMCACPDVGRTFLISAASRCPALPPPTCPGDTVYDTTLKRCVCKLGDGYWPSQDSTGDCYPCYGDPVNWKVDPVNGYSCICRDPNANVLPVAAVCYCSTGEQKNGKCPTLTCASDQHVDGSVCACNDPNAEIKGGGSCQCKSGYEWPVASTKAKRGMFDDLNKTPQKALCVVKTTVTCDTKQHRDAATNKCVCDDENAEIRSGSTSCTCKSGFALTQVTNQPVISFTLDMGLPKIQEEPKCVATTSSTTTTSTTQQQQCKNNQRYDNDSSFCVCNDLNAIVFADTGECECKDGFHSSDGGLCVADSQAPVACPTNQHRDGTGACVCTDVNAHIDSDTGACKCNEHFSPNSAGVCVERTTSGGTSTPQCGQYQSYKDNACVCDDVNASLEGGECRCKGGYTLIGTTCTENPKDEPASSTTPQEDNNYDQTPPKTNDSNHEEPPKANDYDQEPPKSDEYNQPSTESNYGNSNSNSYQPQLRCPSNAYLSSSKTTCICNCQNSEYDASNNKCVCRSGYTMKGNTCVKDTPTIDYGSSKSQGNGYDSSSEDRK